MGINKHESCATSLKWLHSKGACYLSASWKIHETAGAGGAILDRGQEPHRRSFHEAILKFLVLDHYSMVEKWTGILFKLQLFSCLSLGFKKQTPRQEFEC